MKELCCVHISVASQIMPQDLRVLSQQVMPQNKASLSDDKLGEETDKEWCRSGVGGIGRLG